MRAVKLSKHALTARVKQLEKIIPELSHCRELLSKATDKTLKLEAELKAIKDNAKITERQNEQDKQKETAVEIEKDIPCNMCIFVAKSVQEIKGHMKFEHLRC